MNCYFCNNLLSKTRTDRCDTCSNEVMQVLTSYDAYGTVYAHIYTNCQSSFISKVELNKFYCNCYC